MVEPMSKPGTKKFLEDVPEDKKQEDNEHKDNSFHSDTSCCEAEEFKEGHNIKNAE